MFEGVIPKGRRPKEISVAELFALIVFLICGAAVWVACCFWVHKVLVAAARGLIFAGLPW